MTHAEILDTFRDKTKAELEAAIGTDQEMNARYADAVARYLCEILPMSESVLENVKTPEIDPMEHVLVSGISVIAITLINHGHASPATVIKACQCLIQSCRDMAAYLAKMN